MNRANSLGIRGGDDPQGGATVPIGFTGAGAARRLDETGIERLVHLLAGRHGDRGTAAALYRRTGGDPRRILVHLLVALCDEEPPWDAASCAKPEFGVVTTGPGAQAVFRREADYWLIVYDGTTLRLRHSRGLGYLAALLRRPGREIDALELMADGSLDAKPGRDDDMRVRRTVDDDVAMVADARALAAYRRRWTELESEVAAAEAASDLGSVERLRGERTALRGALLEAVRRRRNGTHRERARLAVTKGIGAAIARIAAKHAALGAHLTVAVRRGYACAYRPDPRQPIEWQE